MTDTQQITQYNLLYRPRKWEDIYGQDSTVKALKKRVLENDPGTALLFQGPFGCGKTTLAELYAAALQSKNLDADGNPDWTDPACQAIASGAFDRDTIRLDGAQFSGKSDMIDFVRELNTRPLYDKRKILLVEEVDQLSNAAQLSLLKILETAKPWVTFILLSMEDKVSGAIKSRCQTYQIRSLPEKSIMLGLKHVMEQAGSWSDSSIPNEFRLQGLGAIATAAKGSMRQAVQYLERCIVNEAWTVDQIDELLEVIDEVKTWKLLDAMLNKSKDPTIWRTIIGLKTGEEVQHFYNYSTMLLGEALIAKETDCVYDESARNRLIAMGNHPEAERLFYCLTLHPQMNKPYLRSADLVGCLAAYYQGIDFRPGRSTIADAFKPGIICNSTIAEAPALPKVRGRVVAG